MDRRRFLALLAAAPVVAYAGTAQAHHRPGHGKGAKPSPSPSPTPTATPPGVPTLTVTEA